MPALGQNVTVIPASRKGKTKVTRDEIPKVRVAAYCRVSTDSEEQETSYEAQVTHYTSYIKSKPDWLFAGIYADDGISGTNTMNREAFNNLIKDCKAGKIDMVITKSISRFSRNTVDCLKYTRELKALNIAVYFEKENINTLDAKGEVLMTIMAALAQQESESLSANVRMGIQFRNQQGKVQVNHNRFLGYTKDQEGQLVIDPDQAKIVKRIYREYLEGSSLLQIKRSLENDGIRNGAGNTKWHESNIKQILTNEKYIGDALLQKTYTVDILEKKRSKNTGELPKYYVEGSHEAIIEKSIFLKVQAEMDRRANVHKSGKKRVYSSRYALSSLVQCGQCGDIYRRLTWSIRGRKEVVWKCASRVEHGPDKCAARTIKEDVLHAVIVEAINRTYKGRYDVTPLLKKSLKKVLSGDFKERLQEVETEIKQLQKELVSYTGDESGEDEIGNKILNLKEEQENLQLELALNEDTNIRIEEMMSFIEAMDQKITEYSDELVRKLVENVLINPETVTVVFKSGIEIEV